VDEEVRMGNAGEELPMEALMMLSRVCIYDKQDLYMPQMMIQSRYKTKLRCCKMLIDGCKELGDGGEMEEGEKESESRIWQSTRVL
jgi:hypothetical protein